MALRCDSRRAATRFVFQPQQSACATRVDTYDERRFILMCFFLCRAEAAGAEFNQWVVVCVSIVFTKNWLGWQPCSYSVISHCQMGHFTFRQGDLGFMCARLMWTQQTLAEIFAILSITLSPSRPVQSHFSNALMHSLIRGGHSNARGLQQFFFFLVSLFRLQPFSEQTNDETRFIH